MLLVAAAAIAASAPQSAPLAPVRPEVQARATVRIVAGARISLDGSPNPDAPAPRETTIELAAGTEKVPAKLIEFE